MAAVVKFLCLSSALSTPSVLLPLYYQSSIKISSLPNSTAHHSLLSSISQHTGTCLSSFSISYRYHNLEEEDDGGFDEAVALFNKREYYKCHDVLEALWMKADEPTRTLFHGILQCAVGFHHLFNRNHKGAMMELGEGLCKLKKMNFGGGPFHQFEQEISAALDFVYQTQIELAACGDDLCLAMDQSERSYQLLGGYAAGQHLYRVQNDPNDDGTLHVVFCPRRSYDYGEPPKVKLPTLHATEEHLVAYESN